jgi:hypothetical protein
LEIRNKGEIMPGPDPTPSGYGSEGGGKSLDPRTLTLLGFFGVFAICLGVAAMFS